MSFPPRERTVDRMQPFLPTTRKVRGGRGASSSSPYHAYAFLLRVAPGGARADPMGKRSHENPDARYKLLVEVDLLAHAHPAFHPRLMYYNVYANKLLSFLGAISLQGEILNGLRD